MENPFKKKDPKELGRELTREVDKNKRDINREIHEFEKNEKSLISDIKKAAAKGEKAAAKSLAQNLIKIRKQKAQLMQSTGMLEGVKADVKTSVAQIKLANTVEKSAVVMQKINKMNDPAKILKKAQKYEMEAAKMELNNETMDEILSGAFDADGTLDSEADDVADEVLAGLGIQLSKDLESAPTTAPIKSKATMEEEEDDEKLAKLMI